jgi:transposase-like protein
VEHHREPAAQIDEGAPLEILMSKPLQSDSIYLKRHFGVEIIVLCVRWYITYKLSYRNMAAMMTERADVVSHTTIMRWVIRYAPEFEKHWGKFSRSIGCSWRVDETYIAIKGNWHHLYRTVDKRGVRWISCCARSRNRSGASVLSQRPLHHTPIIRR